MVGAGVIAPWWAALGEAALGVVRVVGSASLSQGARVDGGCTGEHETGVLGVIAC